MLTVALAEGPANLNLVFEPSVGTVTVIVQDGRAAKVCWLPSKAIVPGLTEHPFKAPVPVGPPFATEIVI